MAKSWDSYSGQEHGRKQRASPIPSVNRRRSRAAGSIGSPSSSQSSLPVFSESASAVAAIPPPDVASMCVASPAAAAAVPSASDFAVDDSSVTDYPQSMQELVMNGFDLKRVIKAYELVGDNFDDMLSFLLSTTSSNNL